MKQFRIQFVLICLSLSTSICFSQNPLNFGSNIRTADPSGHVWGDGKMYLYTSHDEECQEDFWMKDWHVFSSSDLVNWMDHGPCLSVDGLSWADNYAWAPDCAYKNGKYYFCFPAGTGIKDRKNPENSTKWMGIGIAVSDSPTGPFTDAIGGPLWTEPYANDPCLFIDDDGKGYIYFHGGDDFLVAEMADDLLSVKGDFHKMDMGGYEPKMEGPWVFKRNGIYYFTMPENNRILTYYMSNAPTGPWKYQGVIMKSEGGNNHHSIVEFKGQWILFYHRWLDINSSCEKAQRHTCAEYLHFNDDGTIQEVERTDIGVGDNLTVPADKAKPRVLVLTDIGGDPDDQMSMVRLMAYANHFDIEGLIATPHGGQNTVSPEYIQRIVSAYGKVRDNLELHEPGYPTEKYLQERISQGIPSSGMEGVGEGKDSPGSELLIRAVDSDDQRPLWVTVWGGPNVLAQALWKARTTRSPEGLAKFVAKLRVYAISDQDNSGPWIRKEFPELFYIVTPGVNAGGGFHHATWIAIGGDKFHGRFGGADFSLVTNEWLDRNIRCKGPLGAVYPRWEFMMEGDTPSFFNLINNGLSDPEHPNWGGWGGRYERYTPRMEKWFLEPETRPIWTNVQDEVLGNDGEWHTTNHATIWRWRSAYQNDFAARMDWTIKSYEEANHPPIVKLDHPAYIRAKPGERVDLSATASTDPDGDALSFEWFCYEEPGTRRMSNSRTGIKHDIVAFDQPKAWLEVKTSRVMPPGTGTMHIILAVTDHGTPRLTRYKRVIVNVEPAMAPFINKKENKRRK